MKLLKLGQTIKDIIKTINDNFSELHNKKTFTVLYDGSVNIPCKKDGQSTTITLYDSLANYDGVILQLDDCCAWEHFGDLTVGKVLKPVHNQFDMTEEMGGWNMFGYNCEIVSNNQLKLEGFIFSGSNFDKNEYLVLYELRYLENYSIYPLKKVIGIKYN